MHMLFKSETLKRPRNLIRFDNKEFFYIYVVKFSSFIDQICVQLTHAWYLPSQGLIIFLYNQYFANLYLN